MKINNDIKPEIAALFAARANPWAPKYEPQLWNDVSQSAYDLTVKRYEPHLSKIRSALGDPLDRPFKVAGLMSRYNDDLLHMLTGAPVPELAVMRRNFMHYLGSTCMSANCYAYSLDLRAGFKPGDLLTPGYRTEVGRVCSVEMEGRKLTALFDGLAKDGVEEFSGDPNRDLPPDGYYLSALLIKAKENTPDTIKDFHFIRYDRDGGCSHKAGHDNVCRSYLGKDLIDPTKPGIMPGYQHIATLKVPAVF